ncbi:hypothetical protein [Enterovibrio norvegicus]|uniref:hypothetical protein n=1 Tax=Enterovibrio norvegicus TaxID=188144 RepID=UPI0002D379F3|nr:hypothetical protein [Enterovibrio norvegicus]OEF57971.1 hypothetical protein A1OU_07120 [Enterovibrio norvegicus]
MLIDITMMRGEIPRIKDHLLPDEASTLSVDCRFERGVVAPRKGNVALGTLPSTPHTLHKYGDNWLLWESGNVSVTESPMAQDPYQRVYFTGDGKPKLTSQDTAVLPNGFGPATSYDLGVPRPTSPPIVTNIDSSTGENPPDGESATFDDEDRLYIQTYVTRFGEEGAPGEASLSALIEKPGSTVTVKLTQPGVNTHNVTHTRLYRSVTSTSASDYLLVAEIPISNSHYVDSARDINGPVIETWDYDVPPENMQGICVMANGICAGFAGNEVMFSEAYLPYAWPKAYRDTTEHEIVGIAAIGTSLVVATKGYPYVFGGITPDAITGHKLDVEQSCVSARSLVVLNGMAMYASPDGLVVVSADGANVVTEPIIDRDHWQRFQPQTLHAVSVEGEYVAQGENGGFIFDPLSKAFTRLTQTWDAAFTDLEHDVLVTVKGNDYSTWQQGSEDIPYVWRSKSFLMPVDCLMNSARIQSPTPEKAAAKFIADGQVVFELAEGEIDGRAFRLPAVRATTWQVEVSGTAEIERIMVASSMQELA